MASPASIAKHPIHPALVPVPIGLWIFSLVADIIFHAGWGGLVWSDLASYTIAGGLIGALAAAIPGLIDFLSLREPKLKRIGATHLSLNLVIVALFTLDLWLRTRVPPESPLPLSLSVVAILLLGVSGWLGGEMVFVHGVGVQTPDARHEPRIETHIRPESREGSRRA